MNICCAGWVGTISTTVVSIRCTSWWWALDTPETCRGVWRNILKINCASGWFVFTWLHQEAQSTVHKILVRIFYEITNRCSYMQSILFHCWVHSTCFGCFIHPSSGVQFLTVSTATGPPLWSSGQSFWLQIQRSRVRFPALPDFLSSSGSGTGSTQPHEVNWGATWIKK